MAGSTEVLQEYLLKIGYQVDAVSGKKFEDMLSSTAKSAFKVGGAVGAMVVAVDAAVTEFAYSMRKVYFSAELSNVSVKNLKAMQYAGEQVGISSDAMAASLHNASVELRNPGTAAWADSLTGMKEAGKDTSIVLNDLVKSTLKYDEYIGAQMMAKFGMDSETYHMWRAHGDELIAKEKEQLATQKAMGVDLDKQKSTVMAYTQTMDHLGMRFGVMKDTMMVGLLPAFETLSYILENSMEWWEGWAKGTNDYGSALKDVGGYLTSSEFINNLNKILGIYDQLNSAGKWVDNLLGLKNVFGMGETSPNVASGKVVYTHSTPAPAPAKDHPGVHRNERNNNPGNLRYGSFAFKEGATGSDPQGFAIFPTMQKGFKAEQDLLAQYARGGINTVTGIVNKYAPFSENGTKAYTAYLSSRMGVNPNQSLDLNDPKTMTNLSSGIAQYEGMSPGGMTQLNRTTLGGGSARSVTVAPVTHVTVTSNDPKAAGAAVVSAQNNAQRLATRNAMVLAQ